MWSRFPVALVSVASRMIEIFSLSESEDPNEDSLELTYASHTPGQADLSKCSAFIRMSLTSGNENERHAAVPQSGIHFYDMTVEDNRGFYKCIGAILCYQSEGFHYPIARVGY